MATIKKNKIEISQENLTLLRNAQFVPEAPVYEEHENMCVIPSGDYEITSKDMPAVAGGKPWTLNEARFTINKETFVARYRSGVTPDEDADLAICVFKANRDFQPPTGKAIKKGDLKVFGINAA